VQEKGNIILFREEKRYIQGWEGEEVPFARTKVGGDPPDLQRGERTKAWPGEEEG